VFWTGAHVLALDTAETQTLVFLWLVFAGSQGILYVTRARGFLWTKPHPGRWLNVATMILIGASIVLALEGWLMAPLPPSLVVGVLLLAAAYLVGADLVKVVLARLVSKPGEALASPAG